MIIDPEKIDHAPFLEELAEIFRQGGEAYERAAGEYGFICRGCEDSCCRSIFFHHTALEYLFLRQGFMTLEPQVRAEVVVRAEKGVKETVASLTGDGKSKEWCPLNQDGLCILYQYRPMICRFHGIPSHIAKPGRERVISRGCGEFEKLCGNMDYVPFDRTPVYSALAILEKRLREKAGFHNRLSMTIAEMITDYEKDRP